MHTASIRRAHIVPSLALRNWSHVRPKPNPNPNPNHPNPNPSRTGVTCALTPTLTLTLTLAQNWSHVRGLFEQLNALPTQQHETDFSRVRSW